MTLADKTLLITGASRGIGQALSKRLISEGATVIGIGRDFTQSTVTSERLHRKVIDLSQLDRLPEHLQAIAREFPGIDCVVCCAGVGRFGSLEEFSFAQIREMIDVNLVQHLFVVKAFLPNLKRRCAGDVILIGSESAVAGGPKGTLYCAAKFGVRGFAQSLRKDCARSGVRVCIINPGLVDTNFFDQLDFRPGNDANNSICSDDVVDAVCLALTARSGTVIDEINLSPQKKVIQFGKPT